jgi:hypothetical protein
MTDNPFNFDWDSLFNQLNGGGGQTFGLPGNTGNPFVAASPLTQFQWQFLKRSSTEIAELYFPSAKNNRNASGIGLDVSVETEPGCNCDIQSTDFIVYNNLDESAGYQKDGKDQFLFSVRVFVSPDGVKIEQAYKECAPESTEALFFLEDNTNDWSSQKIYAKFGTLVKKKLLLGIDKVGPLYSKIMSIPGFSQDTLNELVENGVVEESIFSARSIITGIITFIGAPAIIGKILGEVLDFTGQLILDHLSVAESVWNSDSEEYIFSKENLINMLSISPETIESIKKNIKEFDTSGFTDKALLGFLLEIKEVLADTISSLLIKYNDFVAASVDKIGALMLKLDEMFSMTETIALFVGFWNGLVDFIGGLIQFLGMMLKAPYAFSSNSDHMLEVFDNFTDAFRKINFSDIWEVIKESYAKIKEYFKEKNSEDINFDKVAYSAGFGLAFIASFFIPFAQIAKLAKFGQIGKALLPAKFLEEVSAVTARAGEVVGKFTQSAQDEAIRMFNEILSLLRKGKQAITEFFEKIWRSIADWFLKNSSFYKKLDNLSAEELDFISRMTQLGGKFLSRSQIQSYRLYLWEKKGVRMFLRGDSKAQKRLFQPYGDFGNFEQVVQFMVRKKQSAAFHAGTKQMFFLDEKISRLHVFHEMAHLKQFEQIGLKAYNALSTAEKETYVWLQILETRNLWTEKELIASLAYANDYRKKAGLAELILP